MGRDPLLQLSAGITLAVPATFALAQDSHGGQDAHGAPDTHAGETLGEELHDVGAMHGAGHEEVGAIPSVKQGVVTGLTAVVVFSLVLAVLMAKVWPAIARGLDEREAKIKGEIEAAAAARKQAAEALESYQQNLAEARAESQKMLEETRAQQQKLAADLKAKADAELTEMRDKARRDIEAAKRAALNEIYADAANLATAVAGKILSREVSAADNQRLVEESLNELQAASSN